MTNEILVNELKTFSISVNKMNTTKNSPDRKTEPHIHECCEIYVNITGNVSFVVEKNIYKISPGDIIITKPYEYHHCVYHDDSDHLHYWIMFSPDENPELFSFLTKKKFGSGNHIRMSEKKRYKFLMQCEQLTRQDSETSINNLAAFFRILSFIEEGMERYSVEEANVNLPHNVKAILNYINKNYTQIHTVNEIAEVFFISISTLERYFKKYLSMTPKRYLEDKKLQNACMLLRQNYSVTDACFESGFDDYSHFITIFKRKFDTTPHKYKKGILNN